MTDSQIKKLETKVVNDVKKLYVEYGLKKWEIGLIKTSVQKTISAMLEANR